MLHLVPPTHKARHVTPASPFHASYVSEDPTKPMQIQTRHSVLAFQQLFSPSIPVCRVLGYPTVSTHCMLRINLHSRARTLSALRPLVFPIALLLLPGSYAPLAGAQRVHLPSSKAGVADLESKTQSRRGDITSADGDVDIHFGDMRLRADHVEYNSKTFEAVATGHVQLDYNNEHVDADEAHYNVSTGHGLFHNVRGSVKIERRPNPTILISDNPLYFETRDVERSAGDV